MIRQQFNSILASFFIKQLIALFQYCFLFMKFQSKFFHLEFDLFFHQLNYRFIQIFYSIQFFENYILQGLHVSLENQFVFLNFLNQF